MKRKNDVIMDWKVCFICQRSTHDRPRSTPEGLKSLCERLVNFYKNGGNLFEHVELCYTTIADGSPNFADILVANSAMYHKDCAARYNQRELTALIRRNEKNKSHDDDQCENRSLRSQTGPSIELGPLKCCICAEEDLGTNLHAAGTFHAKKKKTDKKHAKQMTEKLFDMGLAVGNQFLANATSFSNVASRELYYHGKCYKNLIYQYSCMKNEETHENSIPWTKAISFNKVVDDLYQTNLEEPGKIFRVKDLEKNYIEDLDRNGVTITSHVTRFAEKLETAIDGLVVKTQNNVTTACFSETIDEIYWEHFQSPDTFIRTLRKVTDPIRMELLKKENRFDGNFDEDCQIKSINIRLLALVSYLIDGECGGTKNVSQEALTCSQLIMANCKKRRKKHGTVTYRSQSRETPVQIYASLKIYATVRSRTLIDHLFMLGICIPYNRVLEITQVLYEKLRSSYEMNGLFLPRVLKKGIFTVLVKDNIDKNARSTFAQSHYHGISISILQFPTSSNSGHSLPQPQEPEILTSSKKLLPLPKEYTYVKPLPFIPGQSLDSDLYAKPVNNSFVFDTHDKETMKNLSTYVTQENEWLENFDPYAPETSDASKGWAQHHSQCKRNSESTPGNNAILPMINESVDTLKAQYHTMEMNQKTTKALNPEQTPVDTSDQPVFALTKEVQLRFYDQFKEYFPTMGALHIEQVFLKCHGQLIKGSGLCEILKQNKFSLLGTSAVVDVNDIKRARYCIEVTLCSLYLKLKSAVVNSGSLLSPLEWLAEKSKENDMCSYWLMVMKVQMHILIFVRSIREGNFSMYKCAMWVLMKWVFALDHVHYARWLSVHVFDLVNLQELFPDVHAEMMKGNFSFLKTKSQYSRMALDQVHEQNNKIIKGAGGATQLLNRANESALIRWETCGPDIARIVGEFEDLLHSSDNDTLETTKKHHEDTPSFRLKFKKDVQTLTSGIIINPFEVDHLTMINNTSVHFSTKVILEIRGIEEKGHSQFKTFTVERLVKQTKPINEKIDKNGLLLLNTDPKGKSASKSNHTVSSVLLNKLKSAIPYRPLQITGLLETELQGVAQSIAEDDTKLYHGTKSSIKDRLNSCNLPAKDQKTSAVIVELSPLIFKYGEIPVDTFGDFAVLLYRKVMELAKSYDRVDVVFDRYFTDSLKEQTRDSRGVGTRVLFDDDSEFPRDFRKEFLHNSLNKNDLNEYLAQKFVTLHNTYQILIVSYQQTVLCCNTEPDSSRNIFHCTSEEADQRAVRHARDAISEGYEFVLVQTIDTDVLVLLISFAGTFCSESNSVYAALSSCTGDVTYYDVKDIAGKIGIDAANALPFFYAFTGCDTVSSIFNHGKCKCWDVWQNDERNYDITSVFVTLGRLPQTVSEYHIDVLEYYIKKLYAPNARDVRQSLAVDRLTHFQRSTDNDVRKLPMSRPALLEHTRRACFQAGYLWMECVSNVSLPEPTLWGWVRHEGSLIPKWQSNEPKDIKCVLSSCSCKTNICNSCSCAKDNLPCIPGCNCRRSCQNKFNNAQI